jgi:hypothetical protein
MAITKERNARRFRPNAPLGLFFETVVPMVNHQRISSPEPIDFFPGFERYTENVAVFSSGHFLRVLLARWLGLDPSVGRYFKLGTATLTVLGYDHNSIDEPVIRLLNERPGSMR